ncbi:hypothetical protein AKJ56_01525 [candidate division MSBL1 archaeon SCGC-AAA382N08]|uniref:Polymerase beta nucleotidyltransferase domain-containing protein n=1 Tax=candidate division MSBL1 archaeon SCGC-AAA382N08 TaxID=1698285 RepID=A0A133VPB9_9EURY|nr:hypothetical protein AKJ56_01525 [candidate division MSBL1 archaeon SCGC-AAA382N08]
MNKEKIEQDLEFLKSDEKVLSILVFGSTVKGNTNEKSDIDICIVAPEKKPWKVLKKIYSNVNTEKKNYDVHTFEELSLRLKHRVMENHTPIWIRNKRKLEEYFYKYRKLWQDQAKARGVA